MKNWYVFIDADKYYNYGKIVHATENFILVELSLTDGPKASTLYHLDCLAHSGGVFFFEHEKELKAWLEWIETPSEKSKLNVVKFNKD